MKGFLDLSTSMTSSDLEFPKKGFLVDFSQFLAATHISTVNAMKCLKLDQDNLHMKVSALNEGFSSPSADSLDSRRFAHANVEEGYPCNKWLFY